MTDLLVYGSYGYTGDLIVRKAVEAGLDPLLAGRRIEPLRAQSEDLGLDYRAFDVDEAGGHLHDVDVALHCAGPFIDTYAPMVDACLERGTHYLDITGEVEVFEAIQRSDGAADDAGVMLLPGVGFDVVPSDCLAMYLYESLPTATHLTLALSGLDSLSTGTAKTMVQGLGDDAYVREGGLLSPVRMGGRRRRIDVTGDGTRQLTMAIPWGDLSTAYYSTGIPNITVYSPTTRGQLRVLRVLDTLAPIVGSRPVRGLLTRLVEATVEGPDTNARQAGSATIWGEVMDGEATQRARVRTPEPYELTARAALEIATRALDGTAPAGYQTPATAYGADLVTEIEGCKREDIEHPG